VSWREWAESELAALDAQHLTRAIRDFDMTGVRGRLAETGTDVVSFASNDYLGLSNHPAVVAAARDAVERWGFGAGSARLIAGSRPIHSELERELAAWKREERAVLFPTGFAANYGTITALARPGTIVYSDELNHASIVDGSRAARAEVRVYPHRDVGALAQTIDRDRPALVVTDLVFSMDGDIAPVDELAALCADVGALLVLDEAHAVLGPDPDLDGVEHVRVGTLSKTLGSSGGFVAGPAPVIELLTNRARSFVFTTAAPPASAAAARAALEILHSDEGAELVTHLRALVDRIAPGHPAPIVTVPLADEDLALKASRLLLERGLLVPAIRPPTVPAGTSRLRISLSAAHTTDDVDRLTNALAELDLAPGNA
jgi:8-amino-7-oxononanoate synthase